MLTWAAWQTHTHRYAFGYRDIFSIGGKPSWRGAWKPACTAAPLRLRSLPSLGPRCLELHIGRRSTLSFRLCVLLSSSAASCGA